MPGYVDKSRTLPKVDTDIIHRLLDIDVSYELSWPEFIHRLAIFAQVLSDNFLDLLVRS